MSNTASASAQRFVEKAVAAGARPGWRLTVCVGKPINETHVIPTDGVVTVNAGAFSWDGGVVYAATDAALTAVTGAPAPGQYAFTNGVYQFNVGEALSKVVITYRFEGLSQANFPGALQAAFLQDGFAIADLINGSAYAVSEGWLSTSSAASDDVQTYTLEQSGWAEGGGVAPTLAQSAQQLINVCVAIDATPGGARFAAKDLLAAFVGTVGDNTFAPEDVMPGYGYALAEGWVRPAGQNQFDPIWGLTAAGVAAAT
jgi:hypothetical protein